MLTITDPRLRTAIRIAVPAVAVPAVIAFGIIAFRHRRYALISVIIAGLALLLFAAGYEKRAVGSRRMMVAAALTAMSVVGRFIPVFKPVSAITTIAAMYFGGETAFLVGSLSMAISNIWYGQGPWMPFEMFAMGLVGLAAAALRRPLRRSRIALAVFGALSGALYSFVMDVWTVLWHFGTFTPSLYLAALWTAVPYTVTYAAANVLYLMLLARPMGKKLERVKLKYGV